MGSATRTSTAATHAALTSLLPARLDTAEALLGASAVIGASNQLRSTLSNPAVESSAKQALLTNLFGASFDKTAMKLVSVATESRWSSEDDLVAGIEDLGIRAAASSVTEAGLIEGEIFSFARAISSDAELELALGSKLGNPDNKANLARNLLTKAKANPATVAIVTALVRSPRGRRVGALLRYAAETVADQSGRIVATVTSATPLSASALQTVASTVERRYGRPAVLDVDVDASTIGGVRIQVANDVIDGSVAARIAELRIQLAG